MAVITYVGIKDVVDTGMKMETTTLAIVKMVKNLDKVYTSCTMVMLSKVNGPMTALMATVQKDKLTAIYT